MSLHERSTLPKSNLPFAPQVYRAEEETYASGPSEIDALRIELRAEVRALRTLLAQREAPERDLAVELAGIRSTLRELGPQTTARRDATTTWLHARGIEGEGVAKIAAAVKRSQRARADEQDTASLVRAGIERVVRFAPWSLDAGEARIVTVVGPSGVGKTTTLAKLAAHVRMSGRSVALVSCDSFRVGAIDQLERFAGLLGASFHVARSAAALREILSTLKEDVVFVDTSGRPPTNDGPEAAVAALRQSGVVVETILCMTATTRAVDAARIGAVYSPAKPTAICITKTDETSAPSAIVHGPVATDLPLALVCTGPRVPEDVEPATIATTFAKLAGGHRA